MFQHTQNSCIAARSNTKGQTPHLQFFTNVTILSTLPYFENICGEDRHHAYTSAQQTTVQPPQHITTNNGDMVWKFDQLSKKLAHPHLKISSANAIFDIATCSSVYILFVLYLRLWVPECIQYIVSAIYSVVALLATHSVEIAWNALKKLHDSLKQHCLRWIVHSVCIAMPPYTNWVYLIFCKSCGHRTKTSRERDPGPKI